MIITHIVGADTRIGFDWKDNDGTPVTVDTAEMRIDDTPADVITINTDLPVILYLPAGYDLAPGNHTYSLFAVDAANGDRTLISAGLLRSEVMT